MAKKINKSLVGGLVGSFVILAVVLGFILIKNLPGSDPEVYSKNGDELRQAGEYEKAMTMYSRAYSKRGDQPGGKYLVPAAECALAAGDVGNAINFLDMAINTDPRYEPAHITNLELRTEIATLVNSMQQWQNVVDAANKAIEQVPALKENPKVLFSLGKAKLRLSDNDGKSRQIGLEHLRRSYEIDPSNSDTVETLVIELLRESKIKEAQRDINGAEADLETMNQLLASAISSAKEAGDEEDSAKLRLLNARLFVLLEKFEEGARIFKELMGSKVLKAQPFIELAGLYGGINPKYNGVDLAEAERILLEAKEVEPDNLDVYALLGNIYRRQRDDAVTNEARTELFEKERTTYENGLENAKRSKHFRDFARNIKRVRLMQEISFQLINESRMLESADEREKYYAKAEGWIDRLKEEVGDSSADVHYVVAQLEYARGNQVAAIKAAEQALKGTGTLPNNSPIFRLLADLYATQGQWGASEAMIQETLKMFPYDPALNVAMGRVLLRQNRPTEALRYLKPDSPPALRDEMLKNDMASKLRLEVYYKLNQPELAKAEAARMGEEDPNTELLQIRLMAWEGKEDQAVKKAKELYEAEPDNEARLDFLIDIFMRAKRKEDGLAYFSEKLKQNPGDRLLTKATLMLEENSAERLAEVAKYISDNNEGIQKELSLAELYRQNKDYDKEQQHLNAAEQIDPDNKNVIDLQFTSALREGDWDKAKKYADRAGELDMDGAGGLIAKGRMRMAMAGHAAKAGETEKARTEAENSIELLRQGLDAYPSNSLGWTYLAQSYLYVGDITQAKQVLEEAIDIDPTNGHASKMRARIAYDENDDSAFRQFLSKARNAMPEDPWVAEMSIVAKEQENPRDGIAGREKRRKEAPDDINNLVMLARLYANEEVGEYQKAEDAYREALALKPDDLTLAREVANFLASSEVNLPQEGEELLMARLRDEKDTKSKALVAVSLGDFYARQNQFSTAERYYKMAMSFDDSPRMIALAAEFYRTSRQYREARTQYERIIQLGSKPNSGVNESLLQTARSQLIAMLLTLNELDDAKKQIDEFVELYPKEDAGMMFEGAYHLIGGDIDLAEEAFNRHLQNNPDNAAALWQRGKLFALQGRYDRAITDLKQSKSFNPTGFGYQHRVALAKALADADRADEAELDLVEILQKDPDQDQIAKELVAIYLRPRSAKYEAAEALIYKYMRRNPRDYKWPMLLGDLGDLTGDTEKKILGYKSAAELSKNAPETLQAYFGALREAGRFQEIVDYATTKIPSDRLDVMAGPLTALGFAYHRVGETEKAVDSLNRAMAAAGTNFNVYTDIIRDMINILGMKEAMTYVEKAVAQDPGNMLRRRALVHLYYFNGRLDDALKVCDEMIATSTKDADSLFANLAKGLLYTSNKEFEKSREAYERALKIDPNHPMVLNNLSYLLSEELKQPAEALPYAKQAAKVKPNDSNIQDTYGWIQAQNDMLGEASGTLLRALEIESKNIDALYHLGLVFQKRGNFDDAERKLNQAKEFVNDWPDKTEPDKKRKQDYLSKIEKALQEIESRSASAGG